MTDTVIFDRLLTMQKLERHEARQKTIDGWEWALGVVLFCTALPCLIVWVIG